MSSNVGLATPRGSGTSGYVQRSLSVLKPRDNSYGSNPNNKPFSSSNLSKSSFTTSTQDTQLRAPDTGILDHERLRKIEAKVFTLRTELEEEEDPEKRLVDEEIDTRCEQLRTRLLEEDARSTGGKSENKRYKTYEVHEMAAAKQEEVEKIKNALGIGKEERKENRWRDRGNRRDQRADDRPGNVRRRDDGGNSRYRERSPERSRRKSHDSRSEDGEHSDDSR